MSTDLKVSQQSHFRLQASNLAAWLDAHANDDVWWTVDGDPLLMSRIAFPVPAEELAAELRKIGKSLIVADPSGKAAGEDLSPGEIDKVVVVDDLGARLLDLAWEGGSTDWQLVEDEPTSDASAQ